MNIYERLKKVETSTISKYPIIQIIGNIAILESNGRYGIKFLNTKSINNDFDVLEYSYIKILDNGKILFKKDLYGLKDANGNDIIEPIYSQIEDYNDFYVAQNQDSKYLVLDKNGVVISDMFDYISKFKNGCATFQRGTNLGLVTKDGQILFEGPYNNIELSNHFCICNMNNKKVVYDLNGNQVFNEKCYDVEVFNETYLLIKYKRREFTIIDWHYTYVLYDVKNNKKYKYHSKPELISSNRFLVPQSKKKLIKDFNNNLIKTINTPFEATTRDDGFINIYANGNSTLYNQEGIYVCVYNGGARLRSFISGYSYVVDKQDFIIDSNGNQVSQKYKAISRINGTLYVAEKDSNNIDLINVKDSNKSLNNCTFIVNNNYNVLYEKDSKYGLLDLEGNKLTGEVFEHTYSFINNTCGLYVFKNNNKYGIVNEEGKIILDNYDTNFNIIQVLDEYCVIQVNGIRHLVNDKINIDIIVDDIKYVNLLGHNLVLDNYLVSREQLKTISSEVANIEPKKEEKEIIQNIEEQPIEETVDESLNRIKPLSVNELDDALSSIVDEDTKRKVLIIYLFKTLTIDELENSLSNIVDEKTKKAIIEVKKEELLEINNIKNNSNSKLTKIITRET